MEAFASLDRWVARVGPHYMEGGMLGTRALILAARGDPGAQSCIDRALDFGRRSGEAQVLFPALADAALIAAAGGGTDAARRVSELFDELVEIASGGVQASIWSVEFALALALSGQAERYARLDATGPSRWLPIARQIIAGEYAEAADGLAEIGHKPAEALTRLLAARGEISRGNRQAGEAQLRRAEEFWAGVGAKRYHDAAAALTAQTA
jgi:hypothetical protein